MLKIYQKMNTIVTYSRAFVIAFIAHFGQKDKAGKPYIFHPLAVSKNVYAMDEKVVALLHDVFEDNKKYSVDKMYFLNDEQKEALKLLTHNKDEDYFDYVERIKSNSIARKVKIADLRHNSNLDRLKVVTSKDLHRRDKYLKAISILA